MAFKKYGNGGVKSNAKYMTLGGFTKLGEKNPDTITGRYLGKDERPSKWEPGKTKTTFGFDTEEGRVYINGNSRLVGAMESAGEDYENSNGQPPIGAVCTINYLGIEKLDGGKTIKLFEVLFDNEDQIDVEELRPYTQSDEEDSLDSVVEQPASPVIAAKSKADKVRELLKNRKVN